MWKRSELKRRAKGSFKGNYWKTVLVSLLLTLLVGGGSSAASDAGSNVGSKSSPNSDVESTYDYSDNDADSYDFLEEDSDAEEKELENDFNELRQQLGKPGVIAAVAMGVLIFLIVFLIVFALCAVLSAFVLNPIDVGCRRFFLRNLHEPAQVGNIGYAFDNNYKNIAKTMFFRDMYTFFWTLLFIIPGIVKAYEYRMIPYLLADNPQMTKEQAFAESKRMMKGPKCRTFVLDLSFLGWYILTGFTFGILGIFYVLPYVNQTDAALYETLRYGVPQGPVYTNQGNQEYV